MCAGHCSEVPVQISVTNSVSRLISDLDKSRHLTWTTTTSLLDSHFLVQALKFVPQVLAHALLQLKQRHDESESASCEGSVDMAQDENKSLAMDDKSHQSARSDFDDPLSAVSPRLTAVAKSKEELDENP